MRYPMADLRICKTSLAYLNLAVVGQKRFDQDMGIRERGSFIPEVDKLGAKAISWISTKGGGIWNSLAECEAIGSSMSYRQGMGPGKKESMPLPLPLPGRTKTSRGDWVWR